MTLTIEVDDDKGLNELKNFLGNKKEIRLVKDESANTNTKQPEPTSQNEKTDEERIAIIRSLRGALNMSPERVKEFEAYLQETRDELE